MVAQPNERIMEGMAGNLLQMAENHPEMVEEIREIEGSNNKRGPLIRRLPLPVENVQVDPLMLVLIKHVFL